MRLDNIGDVVMTSPALRAIKETNPEIRLTLMASPAGALTKPLLPWVDEVIPWRAPLAGSGEATGRCGAGVGTDRNPPGLANSMGPSSSPALSKALTHPHSSARWREFPFGWALPKKRGNP